MRNKYIICTIVWTLFINWVYGKASTDSIKDSVFYYCEYQLFLFPQEKIYVQTDKSNYIAGDTLWLKAYLLNALDHIPNLTTNFIYAELITPQRTINTRIKIKKEKGVFYGFIPLQKNLPIGNYQLRVYTRYMQNLSEEYFFTRNITILNSYALQNPLLVETKIEEDDEFLTINLKRKETLPTPIVPEKVKAFNAKGEEKPGSIDRDGSIGIQLDKPEVRDEALLLEYTCNNVIQRHYIQLPPQENEFDVSFLPEGGPLPANCMSRIAFKTINTQGLGEDMKGVVVDEKGDTLQSFHSQHLGMGFFTFTPETGQKYYALCRSKKGITKKFELPPASGQATALKADSHDGNLYISVNSNCTPQLNEPLQLLVLCRGELLHSEYWAQPEQAIKISLQELPAGIIQLILTDSANNPISERLFFNDNKKHYGNLILTTLQEEYGKREPVQVEMELKDEKGQSMISLLSVAVTDDNLAIPDTNVTILSYLLLSSELNGYIENPAYYFTNPNRLTRQNLDILMMTQGWSRYNISQVIKGQYTRPDYLPEITQKITGNVSGGAFMNKPAQHFPVTLLAPKSLKSTTTYTDENGYFIFDTIMFADQTTFVIQANTPKGKSRVKLTVNKDSFPAINLKVPYILPTTFNAQMPLTPSFRLEDYMVNGIKNYMLEEVLVEAPVLKKESKGKHWASSSLGKKINSEEIKHYHASDIYQVLMRVPGVAVWGRETVYLTRNYSMNNPNGPTPPLIIVDNVELPTNLLSTIRPEQVDQIEVLQDPESFVFGPKGIGGAIVITTKPGMEDNSSKGNNITHVSPLGYQVQKEIYIPQYKTIQQKKDPRADFRTTVYWNPDIRTDENGKGEFTFYTSDASTHYTIVVEGITLDGKIIRSIKKIRTIE